MAAGKDVYLEKPMTRTIWESRDLKRIAKKTGLITQLGNQGHSNEYWRNLREWYEAGLIGEVEEMHNWTDRPIWNQGPYGVPKGDDKIPATLDYNLWLNVAPTTPYSTEITPFNWRGFRNYGTGAMGDHACHSFDWFYSGLDLGMPVKVVSERSEMSDFGWPKSTRTTFEFAPKGKRPAIKLYWCDASQKPAEVKRFPKDTLAKTPNGSAVVGTKETVVCFNQFGNGTRITPHERMVELMKSNAFPSKTLPRIETTHHRNWVDACLAHQKASSDIVDYAASLNEFVLFGTISIMFPGQELCYDNAKGEFTNVKEANDFFNSRYDYKKEFLVGKI